MMQRKLRPEKMGGGQQEQGAAPAWPWQEEEKAHLSSLGLGLGGLEPS